ncbi:hypothetical protein Trichorick_00479 [Candidatus Trichorickettsia mobilis]|uniref:DUF6468 domain-containing protein n=1 Tax=Candidatus Trichorickettsia mobilis TaxID=1346319 RepID=A0ABZ0USG9_9RICK|nr:DUF6468 domain-containing protein [Candidatus Trichorickettsia mobilis]WPY00598.1 hypothetical protein Trichorick_00479 [Candidatus Trichorickettsia mobilis]
MLLDFLLIILIGICITYCWVLNRRIQDLQNSRIEFARMVKELNVSIVKAAASVTELNECAMVTNKELKSSIDSANSIYQELIMLNEIGNNLANSLSQQITSLHHNSKNYTNTKASSDSQQFHSQYVDNSDNPLKSKFTDDDLAEEIDISTTAGTSTASNNKADYANQFKKFLNNIVTKKADDGITLNQLNYYDSLRRVSTKK